MTTRLLAATTLAMLLQSCVQGALQDESADEATTDTTDPGTAWVADCEVGQSCDPVVVDAFPYFDHHDTTILPDSAIDAYGCDPSRDESGPEVFFEVHLPEAGVLVARVEAGPGIDVDLHLLEEPDPHACLARGDATVGRFLDAGVYVLVADTWVDDAGDALAGPFDLEIDFVPLDLGPCTVEPRDLRMHWPGCAEGIDCAEQPEADPADRVWLTTPAYGPVAQEAHLVTTADHATLEQGWPYGSREGIEAHWARSAAVSDYAMRRDQPWAPDSEAKPWYGQGATGKPVPVEDETWYVNMFWRDRPAPGTRMLVVNPANGRAVVASGGYESGPRSNEAIGGATEEIHDWLGTNHLDDIVMAFLVDQSLPLGPIDCSMP